MTQAVKLQSAAPNSGDKPVTDEQQRTPTLRSDKQRKGWEFASNNPTEATSAKIAAAAGVSTGTATRWIASWRDELGDTLFRGEIAARRAEQTAAARAASQIRWAELREQEAAAAGASASQIRARMLQLLPSVATVRVDRGPDGELPPVVVNGPGAAEIERLAKAYAMLLNSAELLTGHPTRHTMRSVPADQWTPPALPAGVMSDDEKRATVINIRDRALIRKSS